MNRFRTTPFILLPVLFLATVTLSSCTTDPLPRTNQSPEEARLGVLIGTHRNPFSPQASPGDSSSPPTWEGGWILNRHVVTLEQRHLPAGKIGNEMYLFGYMNASKKYWMIRVVAGNGADGRDSASVRWFSIRGNQWLFDASEDTVAGKPIVTAIRWTVNAPTATVARVDTVDAPPPPAARQEMSVFNGWAGTWPNTHQEGSVTVNGKFESQWLGGRNFLAWFDRSTLTDSTGRSSISRIATIWGYSDIRQRHYRIDIRTYAQGPTTPGVGYAPWFTRSDDDTGLVLEAPLPQGNVGGKSVATRYAIGLPVKDTLLLVQQYLFGGITWTDTPNGTVKWARQK